MLRAIKFILFFACLLPYLAQAQPKIKSTYDAAGNRTVRELVPMLTGGGDERSEQEQQSETTLTEDQIKVWPNPAAYQLNIEVSATSLDTAPELTTTSALKAELFDMNGRLVRELALQNNVGNMAVEDLAPGTYFLFVRKGKQWLKWTVQKV